jgi:hypothetical protein
MVCLLPHYELGNVGAPHFIDLVVCDMVVGRPPDLLPPEKSNFSLSLCLSLSLSAGVGVRTSFVVGIGVYRWLIALCPRAAVNCHSLVSKPLAEMRKDGRESDISVNNHTCSKSRQIGMSL